MKITKDTVLISIGAIGIALFAIVAAVEVLDGLRRMILSLLGFVID